MKLNYKDFPFKTNRNLIVRQNLEAAVYAPNNLQKQLQNKVKIHRIKLPNKLYHTSF